jgi:MFS family permease
MTQLTTAPAVTPLPAIRASRKWLTLFLTSMAVFMVTLDVTIVNVAFPAIQQSFADASRSDLSWVLNSYAIVFAAVLVAAGKVADRFGRRLIFFAGLATFSLGSALCGLAPSVELLVGGRVIQAVGAAFMAPASSGWRWRHSRRRSGNSGGDRGAVASIAAATGPSLGAVLVDGPGWRWAFYINLPVAALSLAWGSSVLVESRDPNAKGRPDVLGVGLIAAAMGLLALGIVQGEEWGWTDWRVVGAFVGSAVALPVFVWRCTTQAEPIMDLNLFRIRSFSVANAAAVAYATAFFSMLLAQVLFLTSVWDYSVLRGARSPRRHCPRGGLGGGRTARASRGLSEPHCGRRPVDGGLDGLDVCSARERPGVRDGWLL